MSVLFALAWGTALAAQPSRNPIRVWVGVGLARGGGGEVENGLGLLGQLGIQKRPHHVAVRAAGLMDHFIGGTDDTIGEIGLLYGRMYAGRAGYAAVATGLSRVWMHPCPGRSEDCSVIGIPLVAEAALTAPAFGLGIQGFVTLNQRATFGGAALFLPLGSIPGPG